MKRRFCSFLVCTLILTKVACAGTNLIRFHWFDSFHAWANEPTSSVLDSELIVYPDGLPNENDFGITATTPHNLDGGEIIVRYAGRQAIFYLFEHCEDPAYPCPANQYTLLNDPAIKPYIGVRQIAGQDFSILHYRLSNSRMVGEPVDLICDNRLKTSIGRASAGVQLGKGELEIFVNSTNGFPSAGGIQIVTSLGPTSVQHTGKTAQSFTGCTGGKGTLGQGNVVAQLSGNSTDATHFRNVVSLYNFQTGQWDVWYTHEFNHTAQLHDCTVCGGCGGWGPMFESFDCKEGWLPPIGVLSLLVSNDNGPFVPGSYENSYYQPGLDACHPGLPSPYRVLSLVNNTRWIVTSLTQMSAKANLSGNALLALATPGSFPSPTPVTTPTPTPSPTPTVTPTPVPAILSLPVTVLPASTTTFSAQVMTSTIDPVDDLIGFQADLMFDSSVATFQTEPVQAAGLTAAPTWNVWGYVLPDNESIKTLRLSAVSTDFTPLSGSGILFELEMIRVSNTPAATTTLVWAPRNPFYFFDEKYFPRFPSITLPGSITIEGTAPTPSSTPAATPTQTPSTSPTPGEISGTVFYCIALNLAPGPPVPNVTLTLTGDANASTLSDTSGNYIFSLPLGGVYNCSPSMAALVPAAAAIDATDVTAAQRHFLRIGPPLAGCKLAAADVDGSGTISMIDVIAIQRFSLGLSTGIGHTGTYKFSPARREYQGLEGNQPEQNFDAFVFGDVIPDFVP